MTISPSSSLRVASTFAGIWAAVMLLVSVLVAIAVVSRGGNALSMLVPFGLAVASGASAWGLRGARRSYRALALFVSVAWVAFLLMVPLKVSIVGVVLNFVVGVLILTSWRSFR